MAKTTYPLRDYDYGVEKPFISLQEEERIDKCHHMNHMEDIRNDIKTDIEEAKKVIVNRVEAAEAKIYTEEVTIERKVDTSITKIDNVQSTVNTIASNTTDIKNNTNSIWNKIKNWSWPIN